MSDLLPKRSYRDDVRLSIVGMGGIVVMRHEQAEANAIVAEAMERGVNYFDVGPSYGRGEAEQKLGPALEPYRDRVFLAEKTTERDAAGARRELEQSLRILRTDRFDLYQFHGLESEDEVERILAPGGAGEAFLKARDEGKIRYLGASVHSEEAGIAILDRFPTDSVLFPINFAALAAGFGSRLLRHAKEKGAARLSLKAMAWSRLARGQDRPYEKCWYQPIDDPVLAALALRFTLSQDITAAVPPGDVRLFRMAVDAAARFTPSTKEEERELLVKAKGVSPIFSPSRIHVP